MEFVISHKRKEKGSFPPSCKILGSVVLLNLSYSFIILAILLFHRSETLLIVCSQVMHYLANRVQF